MKLDLCPRAHLERYCVIFSDYEFDGIFSQNKPLREPIVHKFSEPLPRYTPSSITEFGILYIFFGGPLQRWRRASKPGKKIEVVYLDDEGVPHTQFFVVPRPGMAHGYPQIGEED